MYRYYIRVPYVYMHNYIHDTSVSFELLNFQFTIQNKVYNFKMTLHI